MSEEHSTSDPLSLALKQQLDQVCDRFEDAWRRGGRPAIEDYLSDVPGRLLPALLRELVLLDAFYRRVHGEHPVPEEYAARFREVPPEWLQEVITKRTLRGQPPPAAMVDSAVVGDTRTYHPTPAPETPPAATPRRVGKYEVVRPLGQGGQASALLAFDPDLRRHVVLKRYHTARSPEEQEAVLKEGQALARVRSPFVAQCYSAERADEVPFLVMEYVPGKSLAQAQRERLCDLDKALQLVRQLAEGLAAVHACGLLHRDIKPANIVLGNDGQPRLVDFGLASPLAGEELRRVSGTLPYMAPEQARGESERIDARSDVYGLGAVLYELLTGQPPHTGCDLTALWREVRDGKVVPPVERNPRVPAAVSDLCLRCLAADPAQRFRSAVELGEATHRLQGKRRRALRLARMLPLFGGLVAAAALFLGVLAWRGWPGWPPAANDDGGTVVPTPEREELAVTVAAVGHPRGAAGPLLFTLGSNVAFQVTPSRTAYLGLWCVDDEGVVTQLFPNKWESDHLLTGGQTRTVPGSPRYAIRAVSLSKRPEKVIVFASTKRWEPPAPAQHRGAGPEGGYVVFVTPEEQREFDDLLRGLELVAREPDSGRGPPASAKVVLSYLVRPPE
jgi:predicted Ser/Thr protein kinase